MFNCIRDFSFVFCTLLAKPQNEISDTQKMFLWLFYSVANKPQNSSCVIISNNTLLSDHYSFMKHTKNTIKEDEYWFFFTFFQKVKIKNFVEAQKWSMNSELQSWHYLRKLEPAPNNSAQHKSPRTRKKILNIYYDDSTFSFLCLI